MKIKTVEPKPMDAAESTMKEIFDKFSKLMLISQGVNYALTRLAKFLLAAKEGAI